MIPYPFTRLGPALLLILAPFTLTTHAGGPANPDATGDTRRLHAYLHHLSDDTFNGVIVGQNCGHATEIEQKYEDYIVELHRTTGKWVGMVGVDYEYMREFTPAELSRTNRYLIEHWRRGGLVTVNFTPTNPFHSTGNVYDHTGVDLGKLLDTNGALGRAWIDKLDRIAEGLEELRDAGVVVLWRPMQEMNGSHFWYGKRQPEEDYRRLWRHMYRYFTDRKNLDNLLWVFSPLGGGDTYAYPGHAYVDIAAGTSYNNDLLNWGYDKACSRYDSKPVGLGEFSTAVNKSHGTLDTRTYLRRIREKYPRMAYWVCWHSFGANNRHALVHNRHYRALLNDDGVLTIDKLDWRASPAPAPSPRPVDESGEEPASEEPVPSPAPQPDQPSSSSGAPVNLTAETVAPTRIVLLWDDRSSKEEGFYIERSVNGSAFERYDHTGRNTTRYTDIHLTAGERYRYRVYAYRGSSRTACSNIASPSGSYGDAVPAPSSPSTPEPKNDSPTSSGTQMIRNATFTAGMHEWTMYNFSGARSTQRVEDGALVIRVHSPGSDFWNIQLLQPGLHLEQGGRYEYVVRLRASRPRTVRMGVSRNSTPWSVYSGLTKVSVDTRWQRVGKVFTMESGTDTDARVEVDLGGEEGDVFIDGISLKPVRTGLGKAGIIRHEGSVAVALRVHEPMEVAVVLYALNGRRITTVFAGSLAAARHTLPIDARGLGAGTYLLSVRGAGTRRIQRVAIGR
jgi:mannan endo-1,4-beta-mannosidase